MDLNLAVKRLERFEDLIKLMERFDKSGLVSVHLWPKPSFMQEIILEMQMLRESFEQEKILSEVRTW
ncbi:MAG: hypothetical protein KGI08_11560 [Thaumarchaeota archaeon]|nr:hypothetical protein [Nitrososphaerota archaeon]